LFLTSNANLIKEILLNVPINFENSLLMAVGTNLLEIFWKLVRHFEAWTFLQIIWHV